MVASSLAAEAGEAAGMISSAGVAGAGYYAGGGGSGEERDAGTNYYTGAVGAVDGPGWWSGSGAERLGLAGDVTEADMVSVFDKSVAPDGTPIGSAPRSFRSVEEHLAERLAREPDALPERVAQLRIEAERATRSKSRGVDLTYSPMKSITLAHVAAQRAAIESERAGDQDEAARYETFRAMVEERLIAANQVALDQVTRTATTRQGAGYGHAVVWVPVDGLTIASFLQHDSRAHDPQLHIHNAVHIQAVRSTDGEIRALDTKDLAAQAMVAGIMADRWLAEEFGASGVRMEMRPDGVTREIVGVTPEVLAVYSQRRAAIGKAAAPLIAQIEEERGRKATVLERYHVNQWATMATRASKTKDIDPAQLLDRWQERLIDEMGTGLVPIAERLVTASENGPVVRVVDISPRAIIAQAWEAVSEKTAAVSYPLLMLEVDKALPMTGMSGDDARDLLERLTDEAAQSGVQVSGNPGVLPPPSLVAGSYVRPSAARYASPVTIEQENLIRQATMVQRGLALDVEAVEALVDERYGWLSSDQRAALVGVATNNMAMSQLIGPAGTGKSAVVGALADVWQELSGGGRVIGLTTTQGAADELKGFGLAHAFNTSAWQAMEGRVAAGALRGDEITPTDRDLFVIDEASMVETPAVTGIERAAASAGCRTLSTGDPEQLGAVGAGGVMGLIEGRGTTYTLADVRRMSEEWERAASLGIRAGKVDALQEYDAHGRLLGFDTREEAVAAVARAVAADRLAGRDAVGLAAANDTVYDVADAVRTILIEAGAVEADGVPLSTGGFAGIGDAIITRHIDRGIGVVNGSRLTVVGTGEDGSLSAVDANGVVRELPAAYVQAVTETGTPQVQLGYAATNHTFEGKTIDAGHALFTGREDRHAGYPALSRGRERNTAYVILGPDQDADRAPGVTPDAARPSARAVLADVFERDDAERAALVLAEEDARNLANMRTIVGRLENASARTCRARLDGDLDRLVEQGVLSDEARAALAADQSTEHLSRVCRAAEQLGLDPSAVLREAVEERTLDDPQIESMAQVVAGRITKAHEEVRAAPGSDAVIPANIPDDHAEHIAILLGQADDRARELGTLAAQDAPAWAVRALGPVPEDAVERLEWESHAGRAAAYREAAGLEGQEWALGGAPGLAQPELRAAWSSAFDALGRPQETRVEAAMSDGGLRARVAAWEREQAWAPAHADVSLRAAEIDAENARHEATLARALGDDEAAGEWDAVVEERGAVARVMGSVVDARSGWADETAVTRELAERAAEELRERGLEPGAEDDRISAQEWLDHQREVDARDEAVRDVTELDVPLVEDSSVVDSLEAGEESRVTDVSGESLGSDHSPEESGQGVDLRGDALEGDAAHAADSVTPEADNGSSEDGTPTGAADVSGWLGQSEASGSAGAPVPSSDDAREISPSDDRHATDSDEHVAEPEPEVEAPEVSHDEAAPDVEAPAPAEEPVAREPEPERSAAHDEAPTHPTVDERETHAEAARVAAEQLADRESERAARDAWDAEQEAAEVSHDEAEDAEMFA